MSNKHSAEMNEGPSASNQFREAMKTIVSVPKKNLPGKVKGKHKRKS